MSVSVSILDCDFLLFDDFLLVNDFMCKYPHLEFDLDAWQAAQGTANEFVCRDGVIKYEY